jgi:hypothetical protein
LAAVAVAVAVDSDLPFLKSILLGWKCNVLNIKLGEAKFS